MVEKEKKKYLGKGKINKKGKEFLNTYNYKRHVWWWLPNSISLILMLFMFTCLDTI
jgi:hypothetical protein